MGGEYNQPDEFIVESLRRELAPQLVGLLHLSQHFDDIHDTHSQLLGYKELISEVLLERIDHPFLQQRPWVLCPPLHQALQHNRPHSDSRCTPLHDQLLAIAMQ